MASVVLTAQYCALGGTDISAYIRKATIELQADKQVNTTMTSLGWESSLKGIRSGNISIEVVDDFAASQIDSILWTAFTSSSSTTFELRPTQDAVGTGNPKLTGSVNVTDYKAGAGVGELAMKSLTLPTTGAVARATS